MYPQWNRFDINLRDLLQLKSKKYDRSPRITMNKAYQECSQKCTAYVLMRRRREVQGGDKYCKVDGGSRPEVLKS